MQNAPYVFETMDALAYAGLSRKSWDSLMGRHVFPGVPVPKAGHPRLFTPDDMIALSVFAHYFKEYDAVMAGRVATAVRADLKKGGQGIERLWVVLTKSKKPVYVVHREPPDTMFKHEIDVAAARASIEKFAEERLGWKRS